MEGVTETKTITWILLGFGIVSLIAVALLPLNHILPPVNHSDETTSPTSDNNDILSFPYLYQPLVSSASTKTVYKAQIQGDQSKPPEEDKINRILHLFNSYFEETFNNMGIPGSAVVIVYQDQIVYMKTRGVKKVGESDPINLDTIFQIGSCSKAFTATVIASMVDAGKMTWEDAARQYYPDHSYFDLCDTQVADEITIRDLFCHRSGLPQHTGTYHIIDFWYDFKETLNLIRYMPPESDFRTKYAYQNVLLALGGYCAGEAAGMSWNDLVKQKIFQPLQMDSSTTNLQEYLYSPNHASGHQIINGQTQYVEPINMDAMSPAGTISASIKDLSNWLLFQLNNGQFNGQQIIAEDSIVETKTPHIIMSVYPDYTKWSGLGWRINIGPDIYSIFHTGSTQTSTSTIYMMPADDLGIIVLANEGTQGLPFGELLCTALRSLYKTGALPQNNALAGDISSSEDDYLTVLPSDKLSDTILNAEPLPHPIGNYAGNYYSDYWGNLKIETKDVSSLSAYTGDNPNPVTLTHWTGNTFKDASWQTPVIFSNFVNYEPQEVTGTRWTYYGANGTFNRT